MRPKNFLLVPIDKLKSIRSGNDVIRLFDFCIVQRATKMNVKLEDAAKNVIYDWYHRRDHLTDDLTRFLNEVVEHAEDVYTLTDEDFRGFNADGEFDPHDMSHFIASIQAVGMEQPILLYGAIKTTEWLCHIKPRPAQGILDNANSFRKTDCKVFAEIPPDIFNEAANNMISVEGFKMYAAMSSIQGKRSWYSTNKRAIASRMAGNAKLYPEEFDYNRYQIDKIADELTDKHLVAILPGGRTWYFSNQT